MVVFGGGNLGAISLVPSFLAVISARGDGTCFQRHICAFNMFKGTRVLSTGYVLSDSAAVKLTKYVGILKSCSLE